MWRTAVVAYFLKYLSEARAFLTYKESSYNISDAGVLWPGKWAWNATASKKPLHGIPVDSEGRELS